MIKNATLERYCTTVGHNVVLERLDKEDGPAYTCLHAHKCKQARHGCTDKFGSVPSAHKK